MDRATVDFVYILCVCFEKINNKNTTKVLNIQLLSLSREQNKKKSVSQNYNDLTQRCVIKSQIKLNDCM